MSLATLLAVSVGTSILNSTFRQVLLSRPHPRTACADLEETSHENEWQVALPVDLSLATSVAAFELALPFFPEITTVLLCFQ